MLRSGLLEMMRCIWRNGPSFPKHDPVTVGSDDGKFAHSPGFVRERVPNLHATFDDFFVKAGCVLDVKVCEPRVILRLRHRHRIRTVAESQFASAATQECPPIDAEVFREAELFQIERLRIYKTLFLSMQWFVANLGFNPAL